MEFISVNQRKFSVEKLLGKGKGGYSYLVTDGKTRFVVKQIHHEPCSYYQFGNKLQSELNDYEKLCKIGIPMPKLLDVDVENERILKEYVEGYTIFELVNRNEMQDDYINQVNQMCSLLYKANTNIDYFPTNFVVQAGKLFYIDYECNDYMQEWDFEHWGIKYWSKTDEFNQYLHSNNIPQKNNDELYQAAYP